MNVRYRVDLSQIERTELRALLSGGKHASRKLKRAQILLAANAGASDEEIARSVGVGGSPSPLPTVSGDNALAFAAAFYSPDHPRYRRPFALQYQWSIPPPHAFVRGWAAMCFSDDEVCSAWVGNVRAAAPDAIRFDLVVTKSLWGQRGVSATIAAVMVLARDAKAH